jgi:hypothetical protein
LQQHALPCFYFIIKATTKTAAGNWRLAKLIFGANIYIRVSNGADWSRIVVRVIEKGQEIEAVVGYATRSTRASTRMRFYACGAF